MSDRLVEFIKNNEIVQHGQFKLASGADSDFYCDAKKLCLDSEGLARCVPDFFRHLLKTARFEAIGGLELGVVPLIGACLMHCASYVSGWGPADSMKGFIVRKEPKKHGTQRFIEGPVKPGMKVAIVEDVMTTGASAHLAYHRAKEFGLEPVVVGCIVNRKEGADERFASIGLPLVYLLTKDNLK